MLFLQDEVPTHGLRVAESKSHERNSAEYISW